MSHSENTEIIMASIACLQNSICAKNAVLDWMFTYCVCIGLFLNLKFTEFLLGHGCLLGDHFFLLVVVTKVRYWMFVLQLFLYLQNRRYSFAAGIAS